MRLLSTDRSLSELFLEAASARTDLSDVSTVGCIIRNLSVGK